MADSSLIWAATRPSDAGVFYRAPLGTTLPTDATTALGAAFVDHGWLGEGGITLTLNRDTTKHHSFGGDVVKVTQDNYEESLQLTLLETDPDVLRTVFGDTNVTQSATGGDRIITVNHGSLMLPRSAFVVEVIDGAKVRRIVVQEGQVTSVGDITYVHTDLLSYQITIDCYKPATGLPEAVVEYVADIGHVPGS
jgi:hypothetical protein